MTSFFFARRFRPFVLFLSPPVLYPKLTRNLIFPIWLIADDITRLAIVIIILILYICPFGSLVPSALSPSSLSSSCQWWWSCCQWRRRRRPSRLRYLFDVTKTDQSSIVMRTGPKLRISDNFIQIDFGTRTYAVVVVAVFNFVVGGTKWWLLRSNNILTLCNFCLVLWFLWTLFDSIMSDNSRHGIWVIQSFRREKAGQASSPNPINPGHQFLPLPITTISQNWWKKVGNRHLRCWYCRRRRCGPTDRVGGLREGIQCRSYGWQKG